MGSAILAVSIMLACAALSEQVIPAVASQEPESTTIARNVVGDGPVNAANGAAVPLLQHPVERDLRPQLPEQAVMLLAGVVLMGLGGALRTPRCER
jgi:hypothetical protein